MPRLPTEHSAASSGAKQHVGRVRDYSAWYALAVWRKIRLRRMRADLWTCRMCGRNWGHNTRRLVVDHIKAHRGVWERFIDFDNTQCLCDAPCHNRHKQAMEAHEIDR